jgi:hypothetical protein
MIPFTVARALAWPLPEEPPRVTGWRYRVWLRIMETRYREAERRGGRDFAKQYDYIPF